MENLREQGLTKAIGFNNFGVKRLQEFFTLAGKIPAANQVELRPLLQQQKLLDYCRSKGIRVTAYSPFAAPGQVYSNKNISVLENPVLAEIAGKRGKSTAQISLRWFIEQGATIVAKSYNEMSLAQNADIFSWFLHQGVLEKLKAHSTTFISLSQVLVVGGGVHIPFDLSKSYHPWYQIYLLLCGALPTETAKRLEKMLSSLRNMQRRKVV